MDSLPATNKSHGEPVSKKEAMLTSVAAMTQVFASAQVNKNQLSYPWQAFSPVTNICAHLNAFHAYADDPQRSVETNHYCSHLSR
jgi:hypothetical protein